MGLDEERARFAGISRLACYCINATPRIRVVKPLNPSREGVSLVRTCAIRCPAKRLLVFLVFLLASFFLVESLDSIRSCLCVLGLDRSFSLLGKSFS
jgi:hypothetical protein